MQIQALLSVPNMS